MKMCVVLFKNEKHVFKQVYQTTLKILFYILEYFFLESFNLCRPFLMIAIYHQTKTPISFWYRRELNSRSLIQPSETLPIELTGTHTTTTILIKVSNKLI